LLAHQLRATPSNLRVKTWRRLQDLGAIAVKQSIYVLPDSAQSREDSRQAAYTELAAELQRRRPKSQDRRSHSRARDISRYRQRFQAIERVDFFGSAGRDRVASLLASLESKRTGAQDQRPTAGRSDVAQYKGRLWVTRPRPGVDRMASAWLIRRFIDTTASFAFVTDAKNAPADAVPFDMYGSGFGHESNRCTFETLVVTFGIHDRAVARLGEAVHDLDLKDSKYGAPEALTLGAAIDGLQMSCGDGHQLLDQGIILFEAMYRSFSQQSRPPRPRPVAPAHRSQRRK
jgi:hypothetical protein